ncbi:MAG TPA: FmdB family transcriptional regulator [Treponema sp.]|nr:FmdB family transcriptional regulator [Treponema sp.]
MPTYEYECKNCAHTFEAFQSMKDAPLEDCPQCGGKVRRLINGGTGIIFKGSGFYVTDKGKKGSAGSSKPASSGAAAESSKPSQSPAAPSSTGNSSATDSSSSASAPAAEKAAAPQKAKA